MVLRKMTFVALFYISFTVIKLTYGQKSPSFPKINQTDFDQFQNSQYPSIENPKEEYDFIVVGAGAAGCVIANRLSAVSNWNVLLLEAGGYEDLTMDVPGISYFYMDDKVNWNYKTEKLPEAKNHKTFPVPRGKATGGSTVINGMIYARGFSKVYDKWGEKNPDWSFSEVFNYFKKLEHCQDEDICTSYMGKNGPMNIEIPPFRSNLSFAISEALNQYKFDEVNINNPDYMDGFSRTTGMTADGYRLSANKAYLVPIKNHPTNLDLMVNSYVTKVFIKKQIGGKLNADGIEFIHRNQTFRVSASKEVILSAGVFNSAQILMVSGIGLKQHLLQMGIEPLRCLPVGNNLMNHQYIALNFHTKRQILSPAQFDIYERQKMGPWTIPHTLELFGFYNAVNDEPKIEFTFQSSSRNLTDPERYNTFVMSIILLHPQSIGYVRLKDKNPFSKPRIIYSPLTSQAQIETMLQAIKDLLNVFDQPAIKEWGVELMYEANPGCENFKLGSDDFWRCRIERDISLFDHYSGTCKMGPKSDRTAVVNSVLMVHGMSNLRVIDASIMPILPNGHTTAPSLMIGEKGSDLIIRKWMQK